MSMAKTDLRDTRESARRLRFEASALVAATNVQSAIDVVASTVTIGNPVPVLVTGAGYVVPPEVRVVYVNFAGLVTITLGTAANRARADLEIKDVSGNASANNISIVPDAADTGSIDGLNPLVINSDYGAFHLRPDTLAWRVV